MKRLYIILLLIFILVCCKKENKKTTTDENLNSIQQDTVITHKAIPKTYIYEAKVNSNTGLILRKKNSVKSKKLTEIPFNTKVGIIRFTDKFESLQSSKKYNYYGKWVEIEYLQEDGSYISGFAFDNFLNYQLKKESYDNEITKDTVTVTDEIGFIHALSSNRVIWIDTEEINLTKFITENPIDESLDGESYEGGKFSFHHETLILSYYNNLEIRGKKRMINIVVNNEDSQVIKFNNCNNFIIDNVNFSHRIPSSVECGGEVLKFYNCNNFNFQNVHFDGSGTIGCQINNSKGFYFLNCEFYKNSINAISLYNTSNTTFIRCDFHNNNLDEVFSIYKDNNINNKNIELLNCYIKDNKTEYSLFSISESEKAEGLTSLNINNSNIENNNTNEHIFDFSNSKYLEVKISNSTVNSNISNGNKLILKNSNHKDFNIYFLNTTISNNIDFYKFTNKTAIKINEDELTQNNIFNTASDTVLTKYNTYKNNDQVMFNRFKNELTYNNETKEISINKHLLYGPHHIFSHENKTDFFGFPIDFNEHAYVAEGNIIDGKLDGIWELKGAFENRNKYLLNYSNGVLEGVSQKATLITTNEDGKNIHERAYAKYKVINEGVYINGKKHGVWKNYFSNGHTQYKITYNNGNITSPCLYYFPNGNLREKRNDSKNINGETTSYYPNGNIESTITYVDGKIDLNNSTFFDDIGNEKKAIEIESYWIKDENGIIRSFVDLELPEYKNTVHIHYSKQNRKLLGYVYYKNSKPYSVSKNIINRDIFKYGKLSLKTDRNDFEVTYHNSYNTSEKNISFIFDDKNKIKYQSYIDDNDLINNYCYGGELNLIQKSSQYKIINNKIVKHGVSKNYYHYGRLSQRIRYENDNEIKEPY